MRTPPHSGRALVLVAAALLPWACGLERGGIARPSVSVEGDGATPPEADATTSEADAQTTSDGPAPPKEAAVMDVRTPPPDSDTDACESSCVSGRCEDGRCVIDCESTPCSPDPCPGNVPCTLRCTDTAPCTSVSCTNCDIVCQGTHSCNGVSSCSGPGCTVFCCANQACTGTIGCSGAGCSIVCQGGPQACFGTMTCNAGACADLGKNCP